MKVTIELDTNSEQDLEVLRSMFFKETDKAKSNRLNDWIYLQDLPTRLINAIGRSIDNGLNWDDFIKMARDTDVGFYTTTRGLNGISGVGVAGAKRIVAKLKEQGYL